MASTDVIPDVQTAAAQTPSKRPVRLLVSLGPAYTDAVGEPVDELLRLLEDTFSAEIAAGTIAVAYPATDAHNGIHETPFPLLPYVPVTPARIAWIQTAASYTNACRAAKEADAECLLLLGAEAHTLSSTALRGLVQAVLDNKADLALPRYALGQNEGLLNTALLYPLARSIYGVDVRLPLTLDLAMSSRMCARIAVAAARVPTIAQEETILWPTGEAAVSGYTITEVEAGPRTLPQPATEELSTVLGQIAGSLFNDVEARAAFWQRMRQPASIMRVAMTPRPQQKDEPIPASEIAQLIEDFRLAYGSLHEIWSLVLPPNSLLGLKKLSLMPVESFHFSDALWVRVVYDFVLAYRLRTINRGHLMGALTPLYLAWVASHATAAKSYAEAEAYTQALARAFEADKPYLVSRWRWPDRFNP